MFHCNSFLLVCDDDDDEEDYDDDDDDDDVGTGLNVSLQFVPPCLS